MEGDGLTGKHKDIGSMGNGRLGTSSRESFHPQ